MTEKYKNKETMEKFGELVWEWMKRMGIDIFENQDSERLLLFAESCGLAKLEEYDPEKHKELNISFIPDPGDEIWIIP